MQTRAPLAPATGARAATRPARGGVSRPRRTQDVVGALAVGDVVEHDRARGQAVPAGAPALLPAPQCGAMGSRSPPRGTLPVRTRPAAADAPHLVEALQRLGQAEVHDQPDACGRRAARSAAPPGSAADGAGSAAGAAFWGSTLVREAALSVLSSCTVRLAVGDGPRGRQASAGADASRGVSKSPQKKTAAARRGGGRAPALSTPMPNAMVAATSGVRPADQSASTRARSAAGRPAW